MSSIKEITDSVQTNRNEVILNARVEQLRTILGSKYPNLRLPPEADEVLERCLRRRKFNVEEAATQVHSFFKLLSDMHGAHKEMYFLPSIHKAYFFDTFGQVVLKNRDSKGRVVVWANFESMPSSTFSLDKALTVSILILDELTRTSMDAQENGVVYVYKLKGFGLGHTKEFTFSRIWALTRLIQGSLPVSFQAFHVVRSPAIFSYTYALIKPFLRSKIKNRIHFHGNDLTELHRDINPDILPHSLEGDLPDEESVDIEFIKKLCDKDSYYRELMQYGYARSNSPEN